MYVIQPLGTNRTTITPDMLVACSVPEAPPANYNAGTDYAVDAQSSRPNAGSDNAIDVYVSLATPNVGHTPESSPTYWRLLGTTYPEWVAGTYAKDDRVIVAAEHVEYLSLVGGNTAALTDEAKWQAQGPTNRWRALDLNSSTGTVGVSPMTYRIAPGRRIDAVGLAGLQASGYSVTVYKDGVPVDDAYVENLSTRVVRSWKDWLTKPFTFRRESGVFDLPLLSGVEVEITITRTSGEVSVGALFVNRHVFLGDMETEPTDDADNYSRFGRDIGGSATSFIEGRVIPILSAKCFVDAERVPEIRLLREDLRYTPAFYAGLKDPTNPYFGSVQRVGVWRRFSITPGHPDAGVDIDVEEA